MSTWTARNRRYTDRAPLTSRLTWAAWRAVDRLKRATPSIVYVCAVCVFWMLLGVTLLAGGK